MITGLVAGIALLMTTGTALQPVNVQQVSNNTITAYATKTSVVHITHASGFEIITYNKRGKVIKQGDGIDKYNVKIHAGTKLYINAQTGWNTQAFKVNQTPIIVKGNK